jgi:hypothetical protein
VEYAFAAYKSGARLLNTRCVALAMDLNKLFLAENVGGWDLFARAVFGTGALVALAMGLVPPQWAWIAALVAFVGVFSGITRHCTPYALVGLSTKK